MIRGTYYHKNSAHVGGGRLQRMVGLVWPEFCNCLLLGIGLYEMYQGIEIGHPVYAILFSNLLVAFIFSFIGIFAFFTTFGPAYIKGNTHLLALSC